MRVYLDNWTQLYREPVFGYRKQLDRRATVIVSARLIRTKQSRTTEGFGQIRNAGRTSVTSSRYDDFAMWAFCKICTCKYHARRCTMMSEQYNVGTRGSKPCIDRRINSQYNRYRLCNIIIQHNIVFAEPCVQAMSMSVMPSADTRIMCVYNTHMDLASIERIYTSYYHSKTYTLARVGNKHTGIVIIVMRGR